MYLNYHLSMRITCNQNTVMGQPLDTAEILTVYKMQKKVVDIRL